MSDYTFVNAFENDKPSRPRRPKRPRTVGSSTPTSTPRISNYWGVQSNPRPVGPSLIKAVSSNETLQQFFQMLLEHRQEQIDLRMERAAYMRNIERDQQNTLESYAAQHQYDMDQLGYGEAAKDGGSYDLQGIFEGLKNNPADITEKGIPKNDPTYGAKTKDLIKLAGAGLQGEELSNFLLDLVQNKLDRQEFRAQSRSFAAQDAANHENDLERYATQYGQRIERLAAQNDVEPPVIPGVGSSDLDTQAPVGSSDNGTFVDKIFGGTDPVAHTSSIGKTAEDLYGKIMQGEGTTQDKNILTDVWKETKYEAVKALGGDTSGQTDTNASVNNLMWAIDKISRPYYAVSAGTQAYFRLDDDKDKDWSNSGGLREFISNQLEASPLSALGKNPADSFDDLGGIGSVFSAMKSGFTSGGITGVNEHPVLGNEIIAENAARDPRKNIYDNKFYQYGVGFGFDVMADPLSYVGIGIGSNLARGSTRKLVERIRPLDKKLTKTSEDLAEQLKGEDKYFSGVSDSLFDAGKPIDSKTIYNMLGGNFKFSRSGAHTSKIVQDVEHNTNFLADLLERQAITADTKGTEAIKMLARSLSERKRAVLDSFKNDVYMESLRKELGDVGVPMEDFDHVLTTSRVQQVIPTAFQHHRKINEFVEKEFGLTKSVGTNGRTIIRTAHENALAEIERLRSVGKTSKADEMQFKLDEFENSIEESPLHKLIPELKADYRLDDADVTNLFRESQAFMARSKDRTWYEHYQRGKVLDSDIASLHRQIAKESDPRKIQGLEARLAATQSRKNHTAYLRDTVQADTIVKLLNYKILRKQGLKTYTDPERARELTSELDDIVKEKRALAEGKGSTGDDIELSSRETEIRNELKSLEGPEPTKPDLLTETPEQFTKTNDKGITTLDIEELKKHVVFDKYTGHFSLHTTDDAATNKWLRDFKDQLDIRYQDNFQDRLKRYLKEPREAELARNSKVKFDDEYEALKDSIAPSSKPKSNPKAWSKEYSKAHYNAVVKARNEASDYVFKEAALNAERGTLNTGKLSSRFDLYNSPVTESEIIVALKFRQGEERALAVLKANEAKRGAPQREIARIDRELDDLRDLHQAQLAAERKAFEQAKEARVIMEKRLKEDAILRVGAIKMAEKEKHLSIRTWGDREIFAIPGSRLLFKAAHEAGSIKGIQNARQAWANAFVSPTSRLPEEMRVIKARALSEPHVVIKFTIERLQKNFLGFNRSVREEAFKQWRGKGGELHPEAQESILKTFDELVPYFTNSVKVGDETLTRDEINMYLKGYGVEVVPVKGGIKSAQDLVRSVKKIGEGTKRRHRDTDRMLKDPFEFAWNLHVAKELAMARKGLQDNIKQMFGVKRGVQVNEHGSVVGHILDEETTTVIEKLKHQLDWDTAEKIDKNYLFPPEVVPDINRLMDMLEPAKIQEFARGFDRATGAWKLISTIYNPGYWSRNGIGEFMSSWLAGVHDMSVYKQAGKLIQYARHDSKDLETVASRLPGIKIKNNTELGNEVALTMRNGQKITFAEVWASAHDTGIKTNFFDTEFSRTYGKRSDAIRQAPVGKQAMGIHDKMRHAGEWYEDYWRMAHYIHSIKYSKARTFKKAAEDAAADVRKYHFDYSDFTQFEKAVLLRAFPFYKWTRKALPLMVSMMFLKPGKVMAYNKAMNTYSNAATGRTQDDDGFMPTYSDMVPDWIKDQWGYQIGTDDQGKGTFLNIATPQMDSYKALSNPLQTVGSLLNPLIKFPVDEFRAMKGLETTGNTLGRDDEFEHKLGTRDPFEGADLREILNKTPITEMLARMATSKGKYLKNDPEGDSLVPSEGLIKFLTGLGIYEENGYPSK